MSTFESFGKYVLLEKLATGGMAEVFLARGTGAGGIGKFFAIKRILPQYADSPEFIEMFKDEAKIAINLNHSNIVSIHEFGVEKGQFFLVMDYVEGRNLRQILNKMKKSGLQFSMDQIVYVIKEVAGGLDHAHRCIDGSTGKPLNITHRDMSPQNLMVSFEGEVKIVDFGIAKAESQIETTRAGTLKGKFGYMSPEQAEGQSVDLRTDIFSLGIVLWELLANDRLFVANNEINTLRKIRDCQVPSLRKINPNIHTELERVVQKALARDRNLRYQTGAALHRDLNRFLNRQYPDFSPQDFAVFIKSVFADEILSLRKRLVEYSKVNLTVNLKLPDSRTFDEQTSLLDTNTNSLIVAETDLHSRKTILEASSEEPDNEKTPQVKTKTKTTPTEVTEDTGIDLKSTTGSHAHALPPPSRAVSAVLDEKALAAEMHREITANSKSGATMETDEVSSPSISRGQYPGGYSSDTNANNRPTYGGQRRGGRAVEPEPIGGPKPARFATLMVFAFMCVSIYAYLAKYFTPMMSDVIVMTDPYIHGFHEALNIDIKHLDLASEHPDTHATPAPQPAHPPVDDPTESALVVISNPSGAEILVNEKSTGQVTPSRVLVPREKFSITVRKHGYVDYKQREVTLENFGRRMTANLIKMNVAYLDIDVLPPQEVTIFINGKPLPYQHGPVRELPVSANMPLKIRVETKEGNNYDEMTINLPVDKRQAIQLNPHKTLRLPSNLPKE